MRAALLASNDKHVDLYVVDEPLGGPLERIDQLVRADQLESGQLRPGDLPVVVDGMLHAGAIRAEEFYMRAPAEVDE